MAPLSSVPVFSVVFPQFFSVSVVFRSLKLLRDVENTIDLRTHNPKVRGSNPLPATIYISYYINVLRRFLCLKIRSPYFYTPRYTPHTFQVLLTFLLFQAPEV